MAEDAAKVAPHVYKVVFENERVRVLEVSMEPGERADMHSHPDCFVYFLYGGKGKLTTPSGETEEIEWPADVARSRSALNRERRTHRHSRHLLRAEVDRFSTPSGRTTSRHLGSAHKPWQPGSLGTMAALFAARPPPPSFGEAPVASDGASANP